MLYLSEFMISFTYHISKTVNGVDCPQVLDLVFGH